MPIYKKVSVSLGLADIIKSVRHLACVSFPQSRTPLIYGWVGQRAHPRLDELGGCGVNVSLRRLRAIITREKMQHRGKPYHNKHQLKRDQFVVYFVTYFWGVIS